ncbi:MAG: POTRA domain-containing protein, partial [Candidatus Omnitrophota bacterium]
MRRISSVFLAALFLLSSYPVVSAEDTPQGSAGESAAMVTAIEVRGNKAISTNTIISKMRTRVGIPYQATVVSDDLKRLYLLNFFSDIKIDSEPYNEGVKVIITVTERPLIASITFSGINRITLKDEKLKLQLKSREGQYLDYPTLAEDAGTLKKMYEKMGFNTAVVNYNLDTDPETNKVKVNFSVVEGGRVRIKQILTEGNKAFTRARILKLLKTKSAWL